MEQVKFASMEEMGENELILNAVRFKVATCGVAGRFFWDDRFKRGDDFIVYDERLRPVMVVNENDGPIGKKICETMQLAYGLEEPTEEAWASGQY